MLGSSLHSMDVREAASWLVRVAASGRAGALVVAHANAHNLYVLQRRAELLAELEANGRILLEGIGMKALALARGHGLRRDANGTDMAPLVFQHAARRALPIYLLGGRPAVLADALRRLRARYPNLVIAGAHHGYLRPHEEARIAREIRASGAALLVQGRGCPLEEEFALRWSRELGVAVVWNVGGLFDFLAGARPRAPHWMRRARLEWLFRMALEPGRLAPRTFVSFPLLLSAAARVPSSGAGS
jgi:exopolysaccharide biosynthesis WecB/TagA/CpsF family protein